MTVADILKRTEEIRKKAEERDDEAALEDKLREAVFRSIAEGARSPKLLARAVLRTSKIKFSRWCA